MEAQDVPRRRDALTPTLLNSPAAQSGYGKTNAQRVTESRFFGSPVDGVVSAPAGVYTLNCDSGSYSLTGVASSIQRGYLVTAILGSYSLTGQTAAISYAGTAANYTITANAGSYAVSGHAATIARSRAIQSLAGSYTVTGRPASITYTPRAGAYALASDTGSYVITGKSATIERTGGVDPFIQLILGSRRRLREQEEEQIKSEAVSDAVFDEIQIKPRKTLRLRPVEIEDTTSHLVDAGAIRARQIRRRREEEDMLLMF